MGRTVIVGALFVGFLILATLDYVAVSNWSFGGIWQDAEAWRSASAIPLYGSGRWFGPIQRVLVQPLSSILLLPGGTRAARVVLFNGRDMSLARFHVLFSLINTMLWCLCLGLLLKLRKRVRKHDAAA